MVITVLITHIKCNHHVTIQKIMIIIKVITNVKHKHNVATFSPENCSFKIILNITLSYMTLTIIKHDLGLAPQA